MKRQQFCFIYLFIYLFILLALELFASLVNIHLCLLRTLESDSISHHSLFVDTQRMHAVSMEKKIYFSFLCIYVYRGLSFAII